MTDQPDGGGWELAGAVRVVRNDAGWTLLGGWEEDGAVGLRILVHHPDNDEQVKRLEVRVPVVIDAAGAVTLGAPEVVG